MKTENIITIIIIAVFITLPFLGLGFLSVVRSDMSGVVLQLLGVAVLVFGIIAVNKYE